MSEFKVGDKVKVLDIPGASRSKDVGQEAIILATGDEDYVYEYYEIRGKSGKEWSVYLEHLEPISIIRVRVPRLRKLII